jgi:hypothetical protein
MERNMDDRLTIESELAKRPAKIARKCKAHLIREDGTHEPLEAMSIFVDLGSGRDLTINLYERFKGEGICISTLCTGPGSGGRIEITLGAANTCYVNVKK